VYDDRIVRSHGRNSVEKQSRAEVPFSSADQFRDVVRRILNDPEKGFDLRLIASRLGVSYRVLMHWIGTDPERRFPAELIPQFCAVVGSKEALDFLEHQVGRLAFEILPPSAGPESELREAHLLMKESAEAIGSILKAIADGFIEEREALATIAELDDVIRECFRLRHWLEQQTKRPLPRPRRS
jgi:hypothetical protein